MGKIAERLNVEPSTAGRSWIICFKTSEFRSKWKFSEILTKEQDLSNLIEKYFQQTFFRSLKSNKHIEKNIGSISGSNLKKRKKAKDFVNRSIEKEEEEKFYLNSKHLTWSLNVV